ncbi:MAG: sugar transferase [Bacteroidales bacterium]
MINTEFCPDITGLFLLSTDIITGNETEPILDRCSQEYISDNDLIVRVKSDVNIKRDSVGSALNRFKIHQEILNKSRDPSIAVHNSTRYTRIIKAKGDVFLSLAGIILLLPIFVIIGIIIKAGTKGPVLFRQERIGLKGRKFKMYKFRTMVSNAEFLLDDLKAYNEATGPVFKIKYDPRITKVGRFLRKTGLDELPQLINVVKGEMSLIGPRPPLEAEVNQYEPWQLRRLSVIPGITCTWQILPKRHDVLFEQWVAMDLQYIDNWSLLSDIGLFFKTIRAFFRAGGH